MILWRKCFENIQNTKSIFTSAITAFSTTGNQPTKHIISTHNARSWIECGHLCLLEEDACVSFYYRRKDAFQEMNCHLSNDTEASITTIAGGNIDESSWTLFKEIVNCFNNPCKNDGKCVEDGCQAEPFKCICDVRHEGKFCEIESGKWKLRAIFLSIYVSFDQLVTTMSAVLGVASISQNQGVAKDVAWFIRRYVAMLPTPSRSDWLHRLSYSMTYSPLYCKSQ